MPDSVPSPPRPNLFTYATSELSQDAFLCWLLAWADPAHREHDRELHRVARAFVDALFEVAHAAPPAPGAKVTVHKQLHAADVVAEVGDHHVLLIEDKTNTGPHSEQLRRYRERLGQHYAGRELVCVYLKTGDQSCYRDVKAQGWAVFPRAHLLRVLRQGQNVTHGVFIDFLAHLEQIEAAVNRYRTVPPGEWVARDDAYVGFYLALQEELGEGSWGYVNNKTGGFYGFWWGWQSVAGGKVYLQLEEKELVVKVEPAHPERGRELRNRWHQRVVGALDAFRRPQRFGNGQWMTVAVHKDDYRVADATGRLDVQATAVLLRRLTAEVTELCHTAS